MRKQECVLPVKCAKCSATFDLWYDLLAQEGIDIKEVSKWKYGKEEHLCWECRKASKLEQLENQEKEYNSEMSEEDELQLSWE